MGLYKCMSACKAPSIPLIFTFSLTLCHLHHYSLHFRLSLHFQALDR